MQRSGGYIALGIGTVITMCIALCSLLLGIVSLDPATGNSTVSAITFLVLAAILFGFGSWLLRQYRQRRRELAAHEASRIVLAAAARHNYRLTVAQLAIDSGLGLEQARSYLENMGRRGDLDVEVDDNGTLTYCFTQN